MSFSPEIMLIFNIGILAGSFFILAKSADFLVDGAVAIAVILKIPKIVIGIILVGFATTAPEFTVSLLSALKGLPEIALGNAVGSVIVNNGIALGLGVIVASTAIIVDPRILKRFGIFLIAISIITFVLAYNGIIEQWEGLILLSLLIVYLVWVFITEKKRRNTQKDPVLGDEIKEHVKPGGIIRQLIRFGIGVVGVIIASNFLVDSARYIAEFLVVSKAIIGLTVVAIGTSLPEIATCVVASRKGHGDLALGDIMGANILNLLWIIGAAATANKITVSTRMILFSFPSMLIIVITTIVFARMGYKLNRWKGIILVSLYIIYLFIAIIFFFVFNIEGAA